MKIIECPRDAMQGLPQFIPTESKVAYINQLLKVGFDTIDVGSFVSPKAIPQMSDTKEVLKQLSWSTSASKLLVIVANTRGAKEASEFEAVNYMGFPLSISETFQKRNTNASIAQAIVSLKEIQAICKSTNKPLVTYISMGFGNPYGDIYTVDIVNDFVKILVGIGVSTISLADTIGASSPSQITHLFSSLTKEYSDIDLGVHLHSSPSLAVEKIKAAYEAGCQRFDGAIKGFGGCPMADDELVGNLATEQIIEYLDSRNVNLNLDRTALDKALLLADAVFPWH